MKTESLDSMNHKEEKNVKGKRNGVKNLDRTSENEMQQWPYLQ